VLSLMRRSICCAAVVLGWSAAARAQDAPGSAHQAGPSADVKACLDATVEGQELRDRGSYLHARERFIACAGEQCPGEVRKSCVGWLEDTDKLVPTVVFAASALGRDVTDMRVTVDGARVADRVDGKPVALDPGEHRFRFERAGEQPIEQFLVLRAGEKERLVSVRFGPEPPPARPPPAAGEAPAQPARLSATFYALGAVGLTSLVAGAVLDISGYVFLQQCGGDSSCTGAHERAEVQWRFIAGDLLLAAGVGAGVAAWLFRPRDASGGGSRPAALVGIDPSPRGARLRLDVAF
jgi:hypothetical protein